MGKTSASVNANVIGWLVMCPSYMIGAITVSGHDISSSRVLYFVKCTFVFFSSTAHRVETLRQLLRNMAKGKKTVACSSVVLNVGSEVNSVSLKYKILCLEMSINLCQETIQSGVLLLTCERYCE